MIYYYPDIKNDDEFKSKILLLEDHYVSLNDSKELTEGLRYMKEMYLDPIYDIVCGKKLLSFNEKEIKQYQQSFLTYSRVIPDLYQDGIDFLSSDKGNIFIDVMHYFANFYWRSN